MFGFEVPGSGFEVPHRFSIATRWRFSTTDRERRTTNLELRTGTLNTNVEPGTWNLELESVFEGS
jgi:hypothetical protein